MMDLTWYILGILSGVAIYYIFVLSKKSAPNRLLLSGVGAGIGLILFSMAWGVGAILEGVPRAGSMGILFFGLPGLVLLTVMLRRVRQQKELS